ncbi:MAG: extracellular solute-binding protein [Ruminococcus sp.]
MKTTKILALLLAVIMAVGCLAACTGGGSTTDTKPAGTDTTNPSGTVTTASWSEEQIAQIGEAIKAEANGNTVTLKLWGPEKAQDEFKAEAAAFAELFKDYATIKVEVAVQGEGDVAGMVINDQNAAGDVFSFPSDQLLKLTNANAIDEVYFPENVKADNTAASVEAATINGKIYGYPETGDNSYVICYDKRLVSDEQVKTLEGILEACKANGKKFIMNAGDGFMSCTFIFTGGLKLDGFEEDGETQKFNDYDIDQVTAAVKAFAEAFTGAGNAYESNTSDQVVDGFKNGTTAAGVLGSWDAAAATEVLGENVGYAILPTININGTDTQMINMFGYKYLGVNSQTKFHIAAQALAYYMSNEENQINRASALGWTPANVKAQENDAVKSAPHMPVFLAQSEYSVPQTGIAGTFWDPLAALGKYITEAQNDLSTEAIKAEVEACIAGIRDE